MDLFIINNIDDEDRLELVGIVTKEEIIPAIKSWVEDPGNCGIGSADCRCGEVAFLNDYNSETENYRAYYYGAASGKTFFRVVKTELNAHIK